MEVVSLIGGFGSNQADLKNYYLFILGKFQFFDRGPASPQEIYKQI